jgi:predicted nucleic acid-binding protein
MLVVDASAVVELLLARSAAGDVAHHVADHGYELHAPELLDIEVLSAVRRAVALGHASIERGGEAVADLLDLPIARYPHEILVERAWALRDNFSAYDAAYLALAEAVAEGGVPLLTADGRLARAAGEHTDVAVLLVS